MALSTRIRWRHVLLAAFLAAASWLLYRAFSHSDVIAPRADHSSPPLTSTRHTQLAPPKESALSNMPSAQPPSDVKMLRNHFINWNHCFHALKTVRYLTNVIDQCGAAGKEQSRLLECNSTGRDSQMVRLDQVRNSMDSCGDYGDIDKKYYVATRDAARAGDSDAQLCYAQSTFSDALEEGHYVYTEDDKSTYLADAPKYIDAALKRGDWRVVALMATADRFTTSSGLFPLITGIGSPEQIYRAKALLLLGATGTYADGLKASLSGFTRVEGEQQAMVSPETMAYANAWVNQTFEAYFGHSRQLSKAPIPCGDYSE